MGGRVFIISILVFFLSGCAGTTVHHMAHLDGPFLPRSQLAVLEVPRDLHVTRVDEFTSDDLSEPWGNTHVYELRPGEHSVEVYYSPIVTTGDPYGYPYVVTWYAEPGRSYIVRYETHVPWWSAWVEPKP